MIHWAWMLIAFLCGAVFGMFMVALTAASREDDQTKRKWWEE